MARQLIRYAFLPALLLGTSMLGGCYVAPYPYGRYAYAYPAAPVYAAPYYPRYYRW